MSLDKSWTTGGAKERQLFAYILADRTISNFSP